MPLIHSHTPTLTHTPHLDSGLRIFPGGCDQRLLLVSVSTLSLSLSQSPVSFSYLSFPIYFLLICLSLCSVFIGSSNVFFSPLVSFVLHSLTFVSFLPLSFSFCCFLFPLFTIVCSVFLTLNISSVFLCTPFCSVISFCLLSSVVFPFPVSLFVDFILLSLLSSLPTLYLPLPSFSLSS